MKILRLDLRAFGPFTDVSLDLSGGSEGLHVIYGPNEAGKTSALAALRQLFYGIPTNSTDNFIHAYPKLRIGAELARHDGTRLEILRRKGRTNTLRLPDDKTPVDEAQLRSFLDGVDEPRFRMMFGIDHESLVEGGEQIVRGGGEIGETLFAAGAGIADLRTIRQQFEQQAEGLFKPGGAKPAINHMLASLRQAKQELRETQLPSSAWTDHDRALREATKQLDKINTELRHAVKQRGRLERIRNALPQIARRKQLQTDLAAMGEVPNLPADFSETRRAAVARLDAAGKVLRDAKTSLDVLESQIAQLEVPEALLARQQEIEALHKQLGAFQKAERDRPVLENERKRFLREAADVLRSLRPDLAIEDADGLRLTRPQEAEIRRLANRHQAIEEKKEQARLTTEQRRRELAEAESQLATLQPPRDPAMLRDAVDRAQSRGNLDEQTNEAAAELDAQRQQAEVELGRLPLWSGSLAEFEQLATPAAETVDRFETELAEAEDLVDRLGTDVEAVQAEQAEVARLIAELTLQGDVPSEDELSEARRLRDLGWQLVREAWQQPSADAEKQAAFLERFDQGIELAEAYEITVRQADELADRLRREAERVANLAQLQARQAALETRAAALSTQSAEARDHQEQLERAWTECWQPSGIAPLPPREMRPWLSRRRALVEAAEAIRGAEQRVGQLRQRIEEHRGDLDRHLAALGEPSVDGDDSLAAILARCRTVLEGIDGVEESRRQLEPAITRLRRELDAAEQSAKQAEAEHGRWQAQWAQAVQPLGLGPETQPAEADAFLVQTAEILSYLKQAEDKTERIDAICHDANAFRDAVNRLAAELHPEASQLDAEAAVAQLVEQLRRAQADREKQTALKSERQRHQTRLAKARDDVGESNAQLKAMCQEAGCQTPEQLPEVEQAAARAARLGEQLDERNDQLAQLAPDGDIESLVAEAQGADLDVVDGQLTELADRVEKLEQQRAELGETVGGEKQALGGIDSGARAAETAGRIEDLLARLEPDVQQYLRLRLAAAVLRQGIERYRRKNQGPILSRASDLFRQLTLGSFEGLRVDFDTRGAQVLVGVRPGATETVPTSGMSSGTCDQLYLALRLASLETWLTRHEPIPLVVDDIMIRFDDQRAATAVEALGAISHQTQVILFTHHEHLVALCEEHVAGEGLFVHRL